MGLLSRKLRSVSDGQVGWWCPGCEDMHVIKVRGERHPVWQWDDNRERPKFAPSILVRSGHFAPTHRPGDSCWCTYNAEHPEQESKFRCRLCHTYVRGGVIEYLPDCSHGLAGRSVDLPDLPAEYLSGSAAE